MDAITAIRTRRSVRAFLDRPVDRATIRELIEDAACAPFTPIARTGAWHFTIITGGDQLENMGQEALAFARENRPRLKDYEWTEREGFSVFQGAPLAIVISGREQLSVALEECTRAAQLLDIAAHARGLGACWIGSPMLWLRDPEVRTRLGIPTGWMPYACFALGWPASTSSQLPRIERPALLSNWVQ